MSTGDESSFLVGGIFMITGVLLSLCLLQAHPARPHVKYMPPPYEQLALQARKQKAKGEGKVDGKPEADNPWEAQAWLRKTLMNDRGLVPADGFRKAYRSR